MFLAFGLLVGFALTADYDRPFVLLTLVSKRNLRGSPSFLFSYEILRFVFEGVTLAIHLKL